MTRAAPGRVVSVLAATLAGGVLTAYLVLPHPSPASGAASDRAAAALRVPGLAATPSHLPPALAPVRAGPATQAPQQTAGPPTRVVVRRLGVDMVVQPVGVDEQGQMALPTDPAVAGWYRFGSAPDDDAGAVVLAAHVDSRSQGIGPFVRLGSAQTGDEVQVWVGPARVVYRVARVVGLDKATLDDDGLFATTGPARVHLVTCTGDYVKGSGYTQNLVVVADRVTSGLPGRG